MKLLNTQQGFVPIVVLLIIAAVGVGGYTVSKLPEMLQNERQAEDNSQSLTANQESAQISLPEGAAVADELLIGFKNNVTRSQSDTAHQKSKASLKRNIKQINTDVVKIPADASISATINEYKKLAEVEFAEPNFLATAFLAPNDPLYGNQWNLKKVMAEEAYEVSKGGFGPIAIIDTGVDSSHSDLSGMVTEGYNTIDENSNTGDDNGHGTHVAGIASAQTDNGSGIASISYAARIIPIKVLRSDGSGTYDDVVEGIIYASDKGSRIINLSLGGSSSSETLKRAVNYAQSKGSLIVAAAGNNGNNAPLYPAAYPGVLAVSASDSNDNIAAFSNYGSNIFVASPGVAITSSVPGGSYKQYSGTSMAAPHLAGLIALVLSSNSSFSNSEAIDHIKKNAEKVGPYAYDSNGWNPYYGFGRISSGKTLTAIASPSPSPSSSASVSPSSDPKRGNSQNAKQKIGKMSESQLSLFEIQGEIANVAIDQGKFVLKVSGGMPNVLELITGNIVDVFIDAETKIKHGNNGMRLSELTTGSRVHISGKVEQNKLIAKDVILQGKPSTLPQAGSNPGQENSQSGSSVSDNSNSNSAADNSSQGSSNQSDSNQGGQSSSGNNPSQDHIPSHAQDKGRVRGASTTSLWHLFLEKVVSFF